MRTWKILALPALATLFLASPAPGADGPTELGKISQQLDAIQKELRSLRDQLTDAGLANNRNAMKLEDLEKQIADLRAQQRRAFSITPENEDTVRLPATGTIMLRNRSAFGGTFYVNGRGYFVPPYQSLPLRGVPAGTFSYQIAGEDGAATGLRTRYLAANTNYYLNIDPY
jgi:hypothetical protein